MGVSTWRSTGVVCFVYAPDCGAYSFTVFIVISESFLQMNWITANIYDSDNILVIRLWYLAVIYPLHVNYHHGMTTSLT